MNATNCVQIGKIVSFDSTNQTASIQLLLKKTYNVTPQGVGQFQEIPILINCPCMVLFGGTGFMSMPITAGDNCIVLFNDKELDNWFVNGGFQVPSSKRMHDFSDAIAIVGINSLQSSIATYLANGVRLSYATGGNNVKIDLVSNQINVLATLLLLTGSMKITGNIEVVGNETIDGNLILMGSMSGNGGTITASDAISSPQLKSGNGATGSGTHVTVVNGIVTAVS